MYGVVREFQAPLGVTQAVRGRFAAGSSLSTVFVRKNTLDLFIVRANNESARLEHLSSLNVNSAIVSICVARRPSASSDLLFVGFERMRIAVLSWQPDQFSWSTEQLLDLNKVFTDNLQDSAHFGLDSKCNWSPLLHGFFGFESNPIIRADPSGRCVAILSKNHNLLFFLPIRSDEDFSNEGTSVVNPASVFMVDLSMEYDISNVKDFTFLQGMFDRHISILYEPKRTWSGRTAVQRNTCSLVTISADLRSKRTAGSWNLDQLPYDCYKLEAVPDSAKGGLLIISSGVIMQVRHGMCVAGLSLNCYGDSYAEELKSKYDTIIQSDTLVECDAAHCRFLDIEENLSEASQSIALLSLKGGELYFLHVAIDSQSAISMKRAGSTVIASDIVPINERFFILSSRLTDSLLIEYKRVQEEGDNNDKKEDDKKPFQEDTKNKSAQQTQGSKQKHQKAKKRKRTEEEDEEYEMIYGVKPPPMDEIFDNSSDDQERTLDLNDNDEQGTRGVYDDDDELGSVFKSDAASDPQKGAGTWALTVKDTISCFGPGTDITMGPSPKDTSHSKLDLVVAGGYAKNGCLAVVQQFIRASIFTRFSIPDCNGVWTLVDPCKLKRQQRERAQRNLEVVRRNKGRRARNAKAKESRKEFLQKAVAQLKEDKKQEMQAFANASKSDFNISTDDFKPFDISTKNSEQTEALEKNEAMVQDNAKDEIDGIDAKPNDMNGGTDSPPAPGTDSENPKHEQEKIPSDNTDGLNQNLVNGHTKPESTIDNKVEEEESTIHSSSPKRPRTSTQNSKHDSLDLASIELDKEELVRLRHEIEANIPLEEEERIETPVEGEDAFHSYMLLSSPTMTTVLATDSDLEEVMPGTTDFVITEKTIVAGNMLNDYAVVQVISGKVRVLMDGKMQCEYILEEGLEIKKAQISDPLILLHLDQDEVLILKLEAESFVESESDLKDSGEFGVDEFDEYGMPVSTQNSVDETGAHSQSDKEKDKKVSSSSYKNFNLLKDFSSSDSAPMPNVCSSFLYKGSLALEISKEGLLNQHSGNAGTGDQEAEADDVNVINDKDDGNDATLKPEESKDVNVSADDDDRMLYDDDDDNLLYGSRAGDAGSPDSNQYGKTSDGDKSANPANISSEGPDLNSKRTKSSFSEKGVSSLKESKSTDHESQILVLSTAEGGLRVLARDLNYETVFYCPYMFTVPGYMGDSDESKHKDDKKFPAAPEQYQINQIVLSEVMASGNLPGFSTPFLIFTSGTGLPVFYRAFLRPSASVRGQTVRSRLAFKRLAFRDGTTRWLARKMKRSAQAKKSHLGKQMNQPYDHASELLDPTTFNNIGGRCGVFLGGDCPAFLFAERGYPRIHELTYYKENELQVSREAFETGQGVLSFAEFHNLICPRGFVYVGHDNEVRVGGLPETAEMNYDAPTPFFKINLRCTPHKVAYHKSSATYGVLASMPTLTTREERLARILQSLEKHDKRHYQHTAAQAEAETGDEHADRVPPLFEELHELRVYRPDNWNLIKSHKLQKGEVGLAITNMKIDVYKQRMAGPGVEIPNSHKGDDGNESQFAASIKMKPKDVLVVGTGYLNGEDASSRGRLLLFEISKQEVFTEGAGVYTAFQLQLIAEKELSSPVTAVAEMEGYVIGGVGPLISVYKLVGDEIVHLSFAFGQLYCTSIASLKQYVVAADMCKSLSMMYFRDRNNSVNFLGQDYETVMCYATEFLIENDKVSLVVSDEEGNVRLLNYVHASEPKSRGGKRLLLNGGINISARVNKFMRVRIPDRQAVLANGSAMRMAGNQALMFATLDGGIGALVAVNEEEFTWMDRAWKAVNEFEGVRRIGGTNMVEFHEMRHVGGIEKLKQRLLDSRCLYEVFEMSLFEMAAVSRLCGVKVEDFAERLLQLDSVLWRF